ncbi:helix-turn-helix domain-containing protein [Roseinatronobacter alkalisoli]|uniref:XRE family transcriptional regulator n=1 Tax=Roseinatronobacter alkalisoli TaxID=3028235 RepID=A0ABT5TDG3_9RHOB|nr:XRE family transcriptional regulator [Roseinatronobacter sp. HJB301]MDD7973170.1 XRE family transcriptional regulator [Roseinatronobacter sp. HJB301]
MSDPENTSVIRIARAGGDVEPAQPIDLAERVRSLRRARGWTLEQAARAAGLARSTLSKIENGQMSPTYDALKKLAGGLEITVPQLFTPPETTRAGGRMALTSRSEGTSHPTPTYDHRLLAAQLTSKKMLPYQARVRARSMQDFDGWVRHGGEEFLYVLTGEIRLFTEFYAPVDMKRGDSAYYDATMGHNVVSLSREDAEILWVTSLD